MVGTMIIKTRYNFTFIDVKFQQIFNVFFTLKYVKWKINTTITSKKTFLTHKNTPFYN